MLFSHGGVAFIPLRQHPATHSASKCCFPGRRLLLIATVTSPRRTLPASYFSLPARHMTDVTRSSAYFIRELATNTWLIRAGRCELRYIVASKQSLKLSTLFRGVLNGSPSHRSHGRAFHRAAYQCARPGFGPARSKSSPIFHTRCLKKLCKVIFCQNFVKFRPILEIFGKENKLFYGILICHLTYIYVQALPC